MKVPAVNSASVRTPMRPTRVPRESVNMSVENPYRVTDILPLTLGFGFGLMGVYMFKTGKVKSLANVSKFSALA